MNHLLKSSEESFVDGEAIILHEGVLPNQQFVRLVLRLAVSTNR